MPIQFQCPSCNAAIRVDESAAGKKGKCPQCSRELIIPRPAPGPSPSDNAGFPSISVRESSGARRSASRRRQRTGSRFWAVFAPLLLFAIVVGTMVFLLWETEADLEGKLPGEVASDFEIPPQELTATDLGISEDSFASLLEAMRTAPPPIGLIPKRMRLTIEAVEDAIRISIQKTNQTELIRVSVDADRELRAWLLEHRAELDQSKRKAAQETMAEFVKSLQTSYEENLPFDTASWASRLVVLFESGLGYVTHAVTNDRGVRCVFESDAGELYFLLPKSTKSFVLEGRPEASVSFPGRYTIRLSPTDAE